MTLVSSENDQSGEEIKTTVLPPKKEEHTSESNTILEKAKQTWDPRDRLEVLATASQNDTHTEELTQEKLKGLQTLEIELTGDFTDTLDRVNNLLGVALQPRGEGYHLTIISPPESGILAQLTNEQISKLKEINEKIQQGEGIVASGIGYIDGSTEENIKPADKLKKTAFMTFDIPSLQQLRKEIGLPEKYFHVTLGFENGDIHMQEKIDPDTGKKVVSSIPKTPNPQLSLLVPDEIHFGSITGQERIKK